MRAPSVTQHTALSAATADPLGMRHRTTFEPTSTRAKHHRQTPLFVRTLLLGLGTLLAAGCVTDRAPDVLAERCIDVLEYRQSALSDVEVIGARRNAAGTALTVHYEATTEPAGEPISDLIFCAFEPEERWELERVVIGDRELSETELTLVNAELLLRDLSRNPQRLSRNAIPVADRVTGAAAS